MLKILPVYYTRHTTQQILHVRQIYSMGLNYGKLKPWTAVEHVLLKFPAFHLLWRDLNAVYGMKDLSTSKD